MSTLVIKSDTQTPPEGAVETGEFINYGGQRRQVFRETRPVYETRELVDPSTGGPMYKRGPGGIVLNATMKRREQVGTEEVEFIHDDLGNGQVVKVYGFREDPATAALNEKRARRERFVDELFDKAEKVGGLDKLIDAAESVEYPLHVGGPKWTLSDGSTFMGSRENAEAAEAALR